MRESLCDYSVARMGPPVLGASLVVCLLHGTVTPVHGVLIGAGVVLIVVGWWRQCPDPDAPDA